MNYHTKVSKNTHFLFVFVGLGIQKKKTKNTNFQNPKKLNKTHFKCRKICEKYV